MPRLWTARYDDRTARCTQGRGAFREAVRRRAPYSYWFAQARDGQGLSKWVPETDLSCSPRYPHLPLHELQR